MAVRRASGWDEADTPFFEYAERGVPAGRDYLDELGARPRLSRLWTIFLATRLPFLTATLIPVGLGGVVAARDNAFHTLWFVLALVAAMAVHLGLNMANDLFDDANGADAANVTPTPFSGGSRVLQYGLVTRRSHGHRVRRALRGVDRSRPVPGGRTRAGAWSASVPWASPSAWPTRRHPLRLVHRGLGEPVTALGFGPVMAVGTYFACTGRWSWQPVLASLPVALLIALVLYVNQVPDRAGDAAAGKRTLIVRFTPAQVQTGYAVTVAAAYVCIVAEVVARGHAGVDPARSRPRSRWRGGCGNGLRAHYGDPYALMPTMQSNILLHLLTGLLLVIGYVIAVVS